jgi:hypothetical protein
MKCRKPAFLHFLHFLQFLDDGAREPSDLAKPAQGAQAQPRSPDIATSNPDATTKVIR